jgi:hypothetical protein
MIEVPTDQDVGSEIDRGDGKIEERWSGERSKRSAEDQTWDCKLNCRKIERLERSIIYICVCAFCFFRFIPTRHRMYVSMCAWLHACI